MKSELEKLYKTIENNKKMIQQYEKRLQDQRIAIEFLKSHAQNYDKRIQVRSYSRLINSIQTFDVLEIRSSAADFR